jgi:VWFA-related protein
VPIVNFYAADEAAAAPAAAAALAGARPAPAPIASPAAAPAPPLPEDRRLTLAIFVDDLHLTPEARNQALASLSQFFRQGLRPEDRVIVARFDGHGIRLRLPRAEPAAVSAALAEVAGGTSRGAMDAAQIQRRLQNIGNARPDAERQLAIEEYQEILRQREGNAHTLLVALGRFVDGLAGLRGRKALLYVSGELAVPEGDAAISDLARRANAAGLTIYGLGVPQDLSKIAFETTRIDFLGAPQFQARGDDLRTALEAVVGPTGGIAGVDLNRPAVLLDRIRADFSSYYSLGFTPPAIQVIAAGDDVSPTPHKVEVKVNGRRGLVVRYPATFVPRSPDEVLAERTRTALLLSPEAPEAPPPAAADNPLGVHVGFERDELAAYGRREVTLLVTLPLARVALASPPSGGTVREGRLEIFVAARDSSGHDLRMRRIAVPLRVPEAELPAAERKSFAYRVKLELPPGASTLALGVRDAVGGAESTVAARYVAGALATR